MKMYASRTRIEPRYCSIHHDRLDGHSSIVGELSSRHLDLPVLDLGMAFATPEGPAGYIRIIEAWQENRKLRSYYLLFVLLSYFQWAQCILRQYHLQPPQFHVGSSLQPMSHRRGSRYHSQAHKHSCTCKVPHTHINLFIICSLFSIIFDYFLLKL